MKNKIRKILHFLVLPFFPDNKEFKKYRLHKLAKIVTLIVTITTIYTVLWFVSLIYFTIPASINQLVSFPTYLPLNFANLFTTFPLYGIIFRKLIYVPYIGPLLLPFLLIVIFYFLPSFIYRLTLLISKNIYRKKVKIAVLLTSLGIVFFVLYLWKYQQVVSEGAYLIDEHCIKVNPLIIDRKNKYTDQYNLMMASASEEQYMDALGKYRKSAVAYMSEEKLWLAKNRKFLDSRDFNLLMPAYMKEAANYQYQMYEGEYYSSLYLEQAWDEKDKGKQTELSNKVLEETNKSNEAQDKYNAVWEREKGRKDWIFNFVKAPESKCPAKNNNFPVVPNPFAPQVPVSADETKG